MTLGSAQELTRPKRWYSGRFRSDRMGFSVESDKTPFIVTIPNWIIVNNYLYDRFSDGNFEIFFVSTDSRSRSSSRKFTSDIIGRKRLARIRFAFRSVIVVRLIPTRFGLSKYLFYKAPSSFSAPSQTAFCCVIFCVHAPYSFRREPLS